MAAGTYTGVGTRGTVTQLVYINRTVIIEGGYTNTNWTNPDPLANPAILDAEGQGRVLYIGESSNPTIEGLSMTGGDAAGLGGGLFGLDCGGGVYLEHSTSATTLSHNRAHSNTAHFGGGLCLRHGGATINENEIFLNDATSGGGLCLDGTDGATLNGNTVLSNTAGGILVFLGGADTLSGNSFRGNTAGDMGGGLVLDDSEATLTGNVVRGNRANGCFRAVAAVGGGVDAN